MIDLRGSRTGALVAAAGGVGLVASLSATWYSRDLSALGIPAELRAQFARGADLTAHQAFQRADTLLLLLGIAAVLLAVLAAGPAELPIWSGLATAVVGALAAGVVIVRMLAKPGPEGGKFLSVGPGAYLGLLAALAVVAGGALALGGRGRGRGAGWLPAARRVRVGQTGTEE